MLNHTFTNEFISIGGGYVAPRPDILLYGVVQVNGVRVAAPVQVEVRTRKPWSRHVSNVKQLRNVDALLRFKRTICLHLNFRYLFG